MSAVAPAITTVLVAEDDDDSRELLCEFLRFEGYAVLEARDGADAMVWLARRLPDAILLDLRMPGVDGWELLEWIQASPELQAIPIGVATAEPTPPTHCKVFMKPLNLERVSAWLNDVTVSIEVQGRAI